MKRLLTWLFILSLIAAGVGGFWWYQQQQTQTQGAQSGEVLRTAAISQGDLDITVAASGNVAVNDRVDLRFNIPGTVVMLDIAASDRVTAGQVLAQLDTTDLEFAIRQSEIALEQIQLNRDSLTQAVEDADVALAELAIQDAAQTLAVARLSQDAATAQGAQSIRIAQQARDATTDAYNDYKKMLEKYGLPAAYGAGMEVAYIEAEGYAGIAQVKAEQQSAQAQSQWLAAYLAYKQAQQSLVQLQQGADADQIRQLELQIEQAQLNLAQSRARLDDTAISAPFDGIVSAVNIQVDSAPSNSRPALTLLDDSVFFIDVTIDEIDIRHIAVGQSAMVTLDAYPDATLTGTIASIATLPRDGTTAMSGIIAYPLRIRLTDTDTITPALLIREGMTANVTIHTDRLENVLLVPNWAIRTDQNSNATYVYCYCTAGATPVRQDITVGRRNDSYTEVISGLQAGATVALLTEERNLLNILGEGPPSRGR